MIKTILITWWAGFIWSHAVVEFEKDWYKTVLIDNLSNSSIDVLDGIEKILWYKPDFFQLDIRDEKWLEGVFSKYNFDWVIHFAWLKAVGESCQKPDLYFDNNISGSICLFNVMKKFGVKNIVFSSSCTVYGEPKEIPVSENTPLWETTNPYGKTKQLLEKILEDYAKFALFNVINLRYFNPIWAHPRWYLWETPSWIPNNLFPYILKVLKWELECLQIFGWNNTIDGTWIRDYIDIIDLVDWHLKAYNYLEKNNKDWLFEMFNLWAWKWVSVLDMVKVTEKVSWKKVIYKIVWRRDGDLSEIYANTEKANTVLWWEAKVSLEESIANWLKFYWII